ncbi:MAG TPA: glycosyltransferase family 4 protein [Burkholderiales bacterium]
MDPVDVCVVHVAADAAGRTLDATVRVLAQLGLHQVLLPLRDGALARSAQQLEVRALQWPGAVLGRIRALETELAALAGERSFYAVHLHGVVACLLGSRALRGSTLRSRLPLTTRLLFSPQLSDSIWKSALTSRLLRAELAPLQSGVLVASPGEAHVLSRLLERSAEVLPPAVDPAFFQVQRQSGSRPGVLAGGTGMEAVDGVSRLAVLLNSRQERVPVAWLGSVVSAGRAQLEAAGVQVFDGDDPAAAARVLSGAAAYLHLSQANGHLRSLAQAMAAGVPCLATDTFAHRVMIRHGETGLICAGDLDFVEKLILLLRDAAERERIGQAARAEAGRLFTQRHFEAAVLRAYGFQRVTLLPRKSVNAA